MGKTFFTSDLHFFHENVIKFCNRPFGSVEHMNESLVNNWNKVVSDEDHIWVLGDISFGKVKETDEILSRLNGIKHLIVGNHDRKGRCEDLFNKYWEKHFVDKHDYYRLKVDDWKFVLCHFPFASWERGYINLHGHLHSVKDSYIPKYLQYDVGVDLNNYAPVSLDDVVDKAISVPKVEYY